VSEYPEHDKMAKVQKDSQLLGYLIDWMQGRGYVFAEWQEVDHYRVRTSDTKDDESEDNVVYRHNDELVPVHKTVNQWLAEIYDIDLDKIEDEKQQMFEEIRRLNAERANQ